MQFKIQHILSLKYSLIFLAVLAFGSSCNTGKYLKEGDTFIDIGANVGYISVFAMGLVGKTGSVHSFEPVPQYFNRLKIIKEDNPGYNFYLNELV